MLIYIDRLTHFTREKTQNNPQTFGLDKLRAALDRAGIRSSVLRRDEYLGDDSIRAIVVTSAGFCVDTTLGREEYQIRVRNKVIFLNSGGANGTMYGLLELAEIINLEGIDAVTDRDGKPFLDKRGIKFNWPYEPFSLGSAFDENRDTVLDIEFWRDYIDFLAENRYNLLTIWSMNPFEMMFRIPKYPETTPYSDVELERLRTVFDFIFTHAKARGIATYIITWNLRISPTIARGLGLPEQVAVPVDDKFRIALRQYEPVIRDYFREAIKTLIRTYPTLTGLGTSNSEELVGTPDQTEEWVADTYLKAVQELNVPLPFIHRTNMSNGRVAQEMFLKNYPGTDKMISWKYSNAHMYSHPYPQFETLMGAWEAMDVTQTKVIFTVRNDDFQTLRGADPAFVSEYIRGMKRDYVAGFYWGADGYVWARDFQHHPHMHMDWKYDFERHFLQFMTLGRLAYNPDLPREYWLRVCAAHYGASCADYVLTGLETGVRTISALSRLHWVHYDYQWHPEGLLSSFRFQSVRAFMREEAMPGIGTLSVRETARNLVDGVESDAENAVTIIADIRAYAKTLAETVAALDAAIEPEYRAGDLLCTLEDIRAWGCYAAYLAKKIDAALKLELYRLTGDKALQSEAIDLLTAAVDDWAALSAIWSSHYMPYQMGRTNQVFGYSYYLDDVRRDVEIARRLTPGEDLEAEVLREANFKSNPWAHGYGLE